MNPGDILDGRYEIVERLGAGGMGEVYKATHTFLGSSRVIKVVHPQISMNTDARERFLREARAATKVQHPNVATLHDFAALADGSHYMVWEFIDGENLAQRLRGRGVLPPRAAVRIAIQALHGLEAIHRAGIVHRDISPENLMITRGDDTVKIIDLGVAKFDDSNAVSQTRTGIFVGKLRYASPEQLGFLADHEKIDGRADLYSMAMVLVELLTGRPPYEAKSPHEYFIMHAREAPLKSVEFPPDLPGSASLQAVVNKALARDRNERYATASEFAAALETVEQTLPNPRDLATVALPLEADATMRVPSQPQTIDTLHRETVRTQAPAAPTILTPLPAQQPVQQPVAPPPQTRSGINPAWIVGLVAVVALVVGVAIFWPRAPHAPLGQQVSTSTTSEMTGSIAPTTSSAAPQVAEASLTVSSTPTETATTLSAPTVTTTTAPPATTAVTPAPRVVEEPKQAEPTPPPPPAREPEPIPAPATPVPTFVDGGDSDANERALEHLRQELRGTKQVALRAGGMQVELVRAIHEHFPNLQFVDYADVVVRFEGTNERLGRGRKRRAATATIAKNGRVIFRYELPSEVYRVGMTPPEAFADVIADAFEEE